MREVRDLKRLLSFSRAVRVSVREGERECVNDPGDRSPSPGVFLSRSLPRFRHFRQEFLLCCIRKEVRCADSFTGAHATSPARALGRDPSYK